MFYPRQTILAAAAICALPALAQQTITGDLNNSNSDCPNNQVLTQQDGKSYCCPGTIFGEGDERFCCVGAKFEVATPSFASCFPTCTGTENGANGGETEIATSTQSCSTSIFFTNSDYSSLASAAAVSLSSGGSSGAGMTTTTTSGSESSSTGSASSTASSTGSGSGSSSESSATSASASDQSTGGAAAMVTSGPVLGGLVAAGGLLMAL